VLIIPRGLEIMIYLTTLVMIKNDWILVFFIIIFSLLAIVKWLYKERLFNLVTIYFSKDYFLKYGKENQLIFNWFNAVLFFIQSVIIGFLFLAYCIFYKPEIIQQNSLQLFLKSILFVSLFFLVRYVVGKVLAIIFEINKQHEHLAFAKISYLYSSILLIIPFTFSIFYIKTYNLLAFQLTIAIFTILLIIRYVVVFNNNNKTIFSRLFYFILYFCALEIAPVLLVLKQVV
jgi:hypothetical protein